MAKQEDRIDKLETRANELEKHTVTWSRLLSIAVFCIGYVGWLSHEVYSMHATIAALTTKINDLTGKIGDPISATIKELEAPNSPKELAANLNLVRAGIEVAKANNTPPKQNELSRLAKAVNTAVQTHSDLPQAWEAAATLVSYRTVNIVKTAQVLPDCDITRPARYFLPQEIDERFKSGRPYGYLFKNCTLHLNHFTHRDSEGTWNPE